MATISLMAEPGRAADKTAAQTAAGETVARDVDKTAAAPNSAPADAVELAWSNNREEVFQRRRPERTGGGAPVLARDVAHRRPTRGGRSGVSRGHRGGALGVDHDAVSDDKDPSGPRGFYRFGSARYDRPVIDRIHTRSGRQVHRGPKRQGHFVRQPRRRDLQRQDGVPEHRPGDDGARSSRGVSCEQSSVQRQRQRFCSDLGAHVLPATQQPGRRVLSRARPRRVCYVWFANRSIGYLLPPTDQGRGLSKARSDQPVTRRHKRRAVVKRGITAGVAGVAIIAAALAGCSSNKSTPGASSSSSAAPAGSGWPSHHRRRSEAEHHRSGHLHHGRRQHQHRHR